MPRTTKPTNPASRNGNASPSAAGESLAAHRWTFLTNHTHVLVQLHTDPGVLLREVAQRVGITERAVQRIVQELEEDGFIERERVGRRNHYRVNTNKYLRHPTEAHCRIAELLSLITSGRDQSE